MRYAYGRVAGADRTDLSNDARIGRIARHERIIRGLVAEGACHLCWLSVVAAACFAGAPPVRLVLALLAEPLEMQCRALPARTT